MITFSTIIAGLLTTIDLNPSFQDALWVLGQFQTFFILVVYAFTVTPALSISHIETIVKILSLDCTQPDLMKAFNLLIIVSLIYLFGLFSLMLILGFLSLTKRKTPVLRRIFQALGNIHLNSTFILTGSIMGFVFRESLSAWPLERWGSQIVAVSLVAVVMSIIIMFLCCVFSFNSKFGGLSSRRPSMLEIYKFWSKASFLIISLRRLMNSTSNEWILTVIFLFFEILTLYCESKETPFYCYQANQIRGIFSSANIAILFTSLIYSFADVNQLSPLLLWALIFGMIYSLVKVNRQINPEIFIKESASTDQTLSFHKLSYLIDLYKESSLTFLNTKNQSSFNDIMMGYLMGKHSKACEVPKCFHRVYLGDSNEKLERKEFENSFREFLEQTLNDIWLAEIKANKFSCWLKLAFAQRVITTDISKYPLVFSHMSSINSFEKSVYTDILSEHLNKRISEYLVLVNEEAKADVLKFIEYKKVQLSFKKRVKENINRTVKFWAEYQSDVPKLDKIYLMSKEINYEDDQIRIKWHSMKNHFQSLMIHDYIFFSAYSIISRNSESEGYDLLKEYQNRIKPMIIQMETTEEITQATINDLRNIMISVSIEKNRLGVVTDVNGGTIELLGYTHEELKGLKINALMPDYISNKHDALMINHLQSGAAEFLMKNRQIFICDKSGFVKPVFIMVSPSPSFDKNMEYITMVRPVIDPEECILYNEKGEIVATSEGIGKDLMLKSNRGKIAKISDFCDSFREIHRVVQTCEWIRHNFSRTSPTFEKVLLTFKDFMITLNHNKTDFAFPEDEKEYTMMLEFFHRLENEGITLPFATSTGLANYHCRVSVTKNVHYELNELFLFRKQTTSSPKITTKPPTLKDLLKEEYKDPSPEMTSDIFEEKTGSGILVHKQSLIETMQTRIVPIYVNKKRMSEISVGSVNSQSQTDMTAIRDKLLLRKKSTFKTAKKMAGNAISKLADQIEDTHFEILPNSKTYFKDTANDGREAKIYQDKNQIYFDLIEMSKKKEDTSSKSGSKGKGNAKRIEARINRPPSDKGATVMSMLSILFFLTLIIALFSYSFYTSYIFDQASILLEGIIASSQRINDLLLFNSAMRKFDMEAEGLYTEMFPGFVEKTLSEATQQAYFYEQRFREVLPKIQRVYSILPHYHLETILEVCEIKPIGEQTESVFMPIDQVFSMYEACAMTVYENEGAFQQKDVEQVIDTFMDDPLIRSETILELLTNHLSELMGRVQTFLEYFMIVQSGLTLILLATFSFVTSKQINFRTNFYESVIKVDEKKLEPHITRLKQFMDIAHGTKESAIKKLSAHDHYRKVKAKNERVIRRNYDSSKLNFTSVVRIIMQLGVYIATLVAIIIFWTVVIKRTNAFSESCKNIQTNNHEQSGYILILSIMDNYVVDYESTLRNKPVTEEYWTYFNTMKKNQQFYQNLKIEGELDPEIMDIITSNICDRYSLHIPVGSNCTNLAGGSLRYGLGPLLSYILDNLETLLNEFDKTAKTEDDIIEFYLQPVYYELQDILEYVITLPFAEINDIIKKDTSDLADNTRIMIWTINIIYLVSAFVLAAMSIVITSHIKEEKLETQRTLNIIPIYAIMDTPLIARFVKEDFI